MVGAKCHEYEVAEVYLRQAEGDVEKALERWAEDERWEKENPLRSGNGSVEKGKGRRVGGSGSGGSLTRQLR